MGVFKKGLISLSVLIFSFTFYPLEKAEAGWGSWEKPQWAPSGCLTRVWTDATNYYRGATSVDVKIEQNGKCGRVYYRMAIYGGSANMYRVSPYLTGYFSNITPTKKFQISSISPTYKDGRSLAVVADLAPNNNFAYHNLLGITSSHNIHIYQ